MEDKSKLKLIYEDGKPVMKMESDGVRMTFRFAEQEPETDVKENIVNILTSQLIRARFRHLKTDNFTGK